MLDLFFASLHSEFLVPLIASLSSFHVDESSGDFSVQRERVSEGEHVRMDLFFRHNMDLQKAIEHQVTVHGVRGNCGYRVTLELHECKASRTS